MRRITIDWATISSREEFYDHVLPQMAAPAWHGRNLDALRDSWTTGGICQNGPPFAFDFKHSATLTGGLRTFASEVEDLARSSVQSHRGSLSTDFQKPQSYV